jgi:hypothetical protein
VSEVDAVLLGHPADEWRDDRASLPGDPAAKEENVIGGSGQLGFGRLDCGPLGFDRLNQRGTPRPGAASRCTAVRRSVADEDVA